MSFWGAGANKRNRSRKMRNRASVYADVNQHRPREYWNYEALTIQWGYASFCASSRVHMLTNTDFVWLLSRSLFHRFWPSSLILTLHFLLH